MLRDVEVNDPPAAMKKDDEDEQDATGEEIDRAQRGDVIREEGSPCLRRRATRPPDKPGDSSLRDLNAQFAQLAVDSRSAPERIRGGDLVDERPRMIVVVLGRPGRPCVERCVHRRRSHCRCQPTTVSGCTTIKAERQFRQP